MVCLRQCLAWIVQKRKNNISRPPRLKFPLWRARCYFQSSTFQNNGNRWEGNKNTDENRRMQNFSDRQRICESDNMYQVIKTKYQHILIARPFIGSIKLLVNLRKLKLKHFIAKPIFNLLTFNFFLYNWGAILFTWTIPPCGRKLSSWSCPFALRKKKQRMLIITLTF